MSLARGIAAPFCSTELCPVFHEPQGSGTSAELGCSIHDGFARKFSLLPWFRAAESPVCDRPVECRFEGSSRLL